MRQSKQEEPKPNLPIQKVKPPRFSYYPAPSQDRAKSQSPLV